MNTVGRRLSVLGSSIATSVMAFWQSTPALADSQALFNELLDTYINATPAEVFETQRRGGLTLGSINTRSRIMRPNLVNMTAPSIRGNCGGLDLVGGSFSFIDSEQLQQFLRAIASNALNYAFALALEGVCPVCMQQIEKMRDWVNDLNGAVQDSCHFAQSLVNKTDLDNWHQSQMDKAQAKEVDVGFSPDKLGARTGFLSELLSDLNSGQPSPFNAVWSALQKSNTGAWFGGFGDNELLEVIMSITGTLIKADKDENGAACQNSKGEEEYCFRELMPLLSVREFIDGSDGGSLRMYRCDSFIDCLKPTIVERQWPGMQRRVRELLFGPPPGFNGGLVAKLRTPLSEYTEAEQRFMQAAPLPIYPLLRGAAKYEGSLITMGQQIQEVIVVQVARNLVLEMIGTVQKSFGSQSIPMSDAMREKLKDRVTEFNSHVGIEDKDFDKMFMLLQMMDQMARHGSEQNPSVLPSSPVKAPRRGKT